MGSLPVELIRNIDGSTGIVVESVESVNGAAISVLEQSIGFFQGRSTLPKPVCSSPV